MDEQGHKLLTEGKGNLSGIVGIHVDDDETGGHLDGEPRDLAVCDDGFHAGGHLRDVKVLDFHELVEGVVGPHEKDDLPLDGGNHEDGALGVDN